MTTMTLLGDTLTSNLKWDTHIQNLISRVNSNRYLLTVLRRAGTTTTHLLKLYVTFIRPGIEYVAPVWHPITSQRQSNSLERVHELPAAGHLARPQLQTCAGGVWLTNAAL